MQRNTDVTHVQTHISGDLLWPNGRIAPGIVTFAGSRILSLQEGKPADELAAARAAGDHLISVPEGGVAAPGFIDLQINGAFGHDFTGQPRQITAVARHLPRFGVTSFLPTLVAAPLDHYLAASEVAAQVVRSPESAAMLGLHFEGPYLNPAKAGAHVVHYLRRPALEELRYFDPAVVRLFTVAPELPGAIPLIRALVERGIHVGLGHSMASYEQTLAAAAAGARWGTHLFNAMAGLHHRHPGIIGALLSDDRLILALIADGHHIHPAVLHLVAAAKGATGVTLISDAIAAAGMSGDEHLVGEQKVVVSGNAVRLPNGRLAGSRIMLDEAVRMMVQVAKRPLAEVLQMASATPARVLDARHKGQLATGSDADIVILDGDLRVRRTVIEGRVVFDEGGNVLAAG
jgi:N-acetylglucosamine-6-phosphate deacetylase